MKMNKSIIVAALLMCSFIGYVNGVDDPKADFTWTPENPSTADVVQFMDNSTPQTDIVERVWYFGDGNGSIEQNPTHQYARPGVYTVTLVVVWNISGNLTADVAEKNITIENQPPVADAGPDQLVNSRTVTLNGSASYDPDGTIVSWRWDFGDGTTGEGKIVKHTYSEDGVYTVLLNVTDDFGAHDEDTCQITVDTSAPRTTVELNGTLGENGWYISNVTVKLTVNETISGINATFYRLDGGNWTLYEEPFVISEEGEHLLEFYSDDEAGNVEAVRNITIKIDKTAPSVDIATPAEKRLYVFGRNILPTFRKTIVIGKITVEAVATDNIGVEVVKFYVDGEEMANVTTPPYTWKWGGNIGTKNLTVKAFDEAGLYGSMSRNVLIISLFKPRESIETAPEAVATDL
ncbi:MAG: hypothetical protein DRN29_02775 [Thermoplasmata archaeon]|nr:MAG: hypothetical protein DRN29_02775 [Thermoplasmata archaeon]